MAIEQGVVIRTGEHSETAWVMTTRSSACASCAAKDNCKAGSGGHYQEVEALNPVGAQAGDRIQMMISTASLLKATFLLYIFPILMMLGGAVAGNLLAIGLRLENSSVPAALGALVTFGGALFIVRKRGRRLGGETAYRPKIIRILGRGSLATTDRLDATATIDCPDADINRS